jgi:hypothetical protein
LLISQTQQLKNMIIIDILYPTLILIMNLIDLQGTPIHICTNLVNLIDLQGTPNLDRIIHKLESGLKE